MHIASGDVSDAAINHAYVYGKKRVEYLGTDQKCFCAPGRDPLLVGFHLSVDFLESCKE